VSDLGRLRVLRDAGNVQVAVSRLNSTTLACRVSGLYNLAIWLLGLGFTALVIWAFFQGWQWGLAAIAGWFVQAGIMQNVGTVVIRAKALQDLELFDTLYQSGVIVLRTESGWVRPPLDWRDVLR
jgi:hypothetical protein